MKEGEFTIDCYSENLDSEKNKGGFKMATLEEMLQKALDDLGQCPMCGSDQIELRYKDDAFYNGYCRDCKQYFEIEPESEYRRESYE